MDTQTNRDYYFIYQNIYKKGIKGEILKTSKNRSCWEYPPSPNSKKRKRKRMEIREVTYLLLTLLILLL